MKLRHGRTRGQSLVEFAVVLPIFLLVVCGLFDLGRAVFVYSSLTNAAREGARLLVLLIDNGSYGTIRMHQERRYPARVSATDLANPDFAALARAFGGWAETVGATAEFAPALARALEQPGIALLHLKTDIERISPTLTVSGLRNRE